MAIPLDELQFEVLRSSGPGGQNVNKVATAVRLRFDARNSPSLAPEVRDRLLRIAGRRATGEGEILLLGQRFRTQERNRRDVVERLEALVARAERTPKRRRATRPGPGADRARLRAKRMRSDRKRDRASTGDED